MPRIPEETIQEVLAATDVVELVGSYIPLKRAGSGYKGLCPFHHEKSPSFHVNPARNTFHCFGCGAGGNPARFLMDYEGLAFPDAIRKLAQRAGIAVVSDEEDPEAASIRRRRARLVTVQKDAAAWFHRLLLESPSARACREYLRSRGFDGEVARRWQLGYAPESNGPWRDWAKSAGHRVRDLVDSGLLSLRDEENPSRGTYPRFRDRLMFPIANDYGDIIAFSGRVLDPASSTAKYLNSPETPVFLKSRTFFGLDRAKRAILREGAAVICEGQLDLIRCFESGIENIVAPLGTAFTEEHARMLARHAGSVILCFDADEAGAKAAERAFVPLAKAGLEVRVAQVPPGEDPDSLIRSRGIDAFRALLENAQPFFDHVIDRASARLDLTSIRDRVALSDQLATQIACIGDRIAQDTAIHNAAIRLKLAPDELRQRIDRTRLREARRPARPTSASAARRESGDEEDEVTSPARIEDRSIAVLLRLALTDRASADWLRDPGRIAVLREHPEGELLVRLLERSVDPEQGAAVNAFLASLPKSREAMIARLLDEPVPARTVEDARVYLLGIERDQLARRRDALRHAMAAPTPEALAEVISLTERMETIAREMDGHRAPGIH